MIDRDGLLLNPLRGQEAGADAAAKRASGNGLPPFPVLSDYLSVPAPRFAVPPGFASGCSPAGG